MGSAVDAVGRPIALDMPMMIEVQLWWAVLATGQAPATHPSRRVLGRGLAEAGFPIGCSEGTGFWASSSVG